MHLKIQTHNLVAKTHTVKAGTFPVEVYQVHSDGLYVQRDFVGHPRHKHWQAHILPALNLQVCRFFPHQGEPEWEYYIDIVQVTQEGHIWTVQDNYLDVIITPAGKVQILDTEELLEASQAGLLNSAQLALTLQTTHSLVNLLSKHNNHLDNALAALGVQLEWDYSVVK